MFFRHSADERSEPPPPGSVHARIDQIEPLDEFEGAPSLILLNCVDAEWPDGIAQNPRHLSDRELSEADSRMSIMSMSSESLKGLESSPQGDRGEHPEWLRLDLRGSDKSPVVEQFHNLFRDPTERRLCSARPVNTEQARTLFFNFCKGDHEREDIQ